MEQNFTTNQSKNSLTVQWILRNKLIFNPNFVFHELMRDGICYKRGKINSRVKEIIQKYCQLTLCGRYNHTIEKYGHHTKNKKSIL